MKDKSKHKEINARLMAWTPGAPNFSRDDAIAAVGLQCSEKCFPVEDVLKWLGPPEKSDGNASAGYLAYFYSYEFWGAPVFDVVDGKVVHFGVVSINQPNCKRVDSETGREIYFNILDEMESFNEAAFN